MIGAALRECRKTLVEREVGDRMIVLISDGYSADLSGRDSELAQQMIADNIIVYAVHVADGDVPDEIVNITQLTGGEVFNPGDVDGLKGVFQRIDSMQKTRLEKIAAETRDRFVPFCIAGLSLLGSSLLGLFGLRYTPW
jgi:Ca-activated chloride channel family protein